MSAGWRPPFTGIKACEAVPSSSNRTLISSFAELLPQVYSGESFPGFERINHDFGTLEAVFGAERPDWKAALQSMKGVYVISDRSNGKQYIGSAYGWNDELVKLVQTKGPKYARESFYSPARRNFGSVTSGVTASKTTSTGIPIASSSGAQSTTWLSNRTPSSISITTAA
jgi:hypothetical protein